jgi:hypothetical protein
VTSYESSFEYSSAPNALLTSIRQGDKAGSTLTQIQGAHHEDIEWCSEEPGRRPTSNAHRAQTLSEHTRTCNTVAHVYM